uniref:Uncharacterized protein n=1 Tax=Mus musculus TaxID=10090 RepID=Q3V0B3_MOUSE|nr:unnamed protein product [Mus musculus]
MDVTHFPEGLNYTQNPTNTMCCLNMNRMQLRIHRWETEPSQSKPADTAHCCVGVDALHEVCCCSVWEKGEKPKAHARNPVAAPNSPTSIKSGATSGQVTDKVSLPARVR